VYVHLGLDEDEQDLQVQPLLLREISVVVDGASSAGSRRLYVMGCCTQVFDGEVSAHEPSYSQEWRNFWMPSSASDAARHFTWSRGNR